MSTIATRPAPAARTTPKPPIPRLAELNSRCAAALRRLCQQLCSAGAQVVERAARWLEPTAVMVPVAVRVSGGLATLPGLIGTPDWRVAGPRFSGGGPEWPAAAGGVASDYARRSAALWGNHPRRRASLGADEARPPPGVEPIADLHHAHRN